MRKVWERERGKGGVCVSEGRQNPESECGTQWVVTKANRSHTKQTQRTTQRRNFVFNLTSGLVERYHY